ncbi:rhomboid family intramembrane serine protease [Roseovarius pacificus]|uniref:rhomboid family intramembrane serine protease n=1 Tax=Roseovarius pacificus TaxID=337701 RepID=UPI002967BCC5|nr:rhomboid family intramembrane serine protease [Roseovarius pacificus]MDW3117873.1 rhomboid family intramembrane serine protease [Roseovarius pacificus]
MSSPQTDSPVNPIPPVVIALFLAIIVIEAVFSLGTRGMIGGPEAVGWRQGAIQDYGFNAEIFGWMLQNGVWPLEHVKRFITYVFVHGSFTHALFAGVMLLALGKFVGEVFSQWATLLLFVTSAIAGAVVFGLVAPERPWLIGAFPGVYGLIGGFTYLLWLRLGQMGENQARAFSLIGILMVLQLIFGLLFGSNSTWLADVSGFGFGFLLSFFLAPGGWAKIRARIRHR